MTRHFLTGSELSKPELQALLHRALELKADPLGSDALARRTVALIFQRPSTRTRISFEAGVAELGGHPMVLRTDDLQLTRGESVRDTAHVLSRHVSAIGIRTGPDELVRELAARASVPVINMLTAGHHPCQALADLLTLLECFGRLEGLTLAYVGDGNNVARSLAIVGAIAGVHVRIASPSGYGLEQVAGAVLTDDPREAVKDADAVYTDVWVSMSDAPETVVQRCRALAPYRLDAELLGLAAPHAVALHCLPAHPGEEITAAVLYGDRQRIWDQAENRRHAQKALLERLVSPERQGSPERPNQPERPTGPSAPPSPNPPPRPSAPASPSASRLAGGSVQAIRPTRGAELELSVDSLAFGGAGVARLDGYVVFVADAIPGDRVRAIVGKSKRAYAEARAVEILEPSPDRLDPIAQHPGAPWQALPYERQLEVKQQQVDDALKRIGHLHSYALEPILPAAQTWRYRNKLEYSFGADPEDRLVCGFHAPGRWDQIVEVGDCLLASEAGNAVREQVVQWCRAQNLTPYDRRSGEGLLRNLVVREGKRTGELQVRLVTGPGELDRHSLTQAVSAADGLLWTRQHGVGETTQGGETELLSGADKLAEEIGGLRIAISSQAFFQTNTEMAERLYRIAIELAGLRGYERVYDLYSGIGTIALLLAPHAAEVWGLELLEPAVADAIANARANEIDNVRFFAGDVRLALRELAAQAGRPDVLFVDPPRSGLSQKVVRRIIETAPRRIVYVSCNPTTLAPNAAQLVDAGYQLTRVCPIDMFPQTPHIECVAELQRK